MFSSLGWPEIAVLFVLAMFVFGPDRLPGLAADAGRALRRAREFARGVRDDLAEDMPELKSVDMRSLHPKTFLVRHVLADEPATRPRATRPAVRVHPTSPEPHRRPTVAQSERTGDMTEGRSDRGGSDGELGND